MLAVIQRLHEVLNSVKGFDNVGYAGNTVHQGYMMLDYQGKRYAVKLVEIEKPSINPFNDLDKLKYHV